MAMGYNENRPKFNFKLLVMRYLFIYLFIISCNVKQENNVSATNIVQNQELLSITCSLITLDGKKKIYIIKDNSISFFGKKERLSLDEINIIIKYPQEISIKSKKYGCGVCVDGVDFEFIFQFKEHHTIYEIKPGKKMPNEIEYFFKFLIDKYNGILINR